MPLFSKADRDAHVIDVESLIAESGVIYADFSAAQPTGSSFILVGSAHFNEARIDLDDRHFCTFFLRTARVRASAMNGTFDYSTIAYVNAMQSSREFRLRRIQASESATTKKGKLAASASLSAGSGLGGRLEAGGELARTFTTAHRGSLKLDRKQRLQNIRADVSSPTGDVQRITWVIGPDSAQPVKLADRLLDVVHGRQFDEANEAGGLAVVKLLAADGYVNLDLEVRAADIEWVTLQLPGTSVWSKLKGRLTRAKSKRDVVCRLAFSKAFQGRIPLQRVPRLDREPDA